MSHPHWHDPKNHVPGERIDPTSHVPRRPDLVRQPGESNKDALLRLSGIVLATERDRDAAQAAIRRVEAVVQRWQDEAEGTSTTLGWQRWVEIRQAIAGVSDDPAPTVFRADDGREWRSDHPAAEEMPTGEAFLDRYHTPGLISPSE